MELELPEQELYRPPLTIRAVDCRSFGRYTLVGTHTIASIHKYMWNPATNGHAGNYLSAGDCVLTPGTGCGFGCVEIDSRECSPLLPKDTPASPHYGTQAPAQSKKEQKTEANRRRKRGADRERAPGGGGGGDDDDGTRDWWTKYFASVEASIQVRLDPTQRPRN
ncbi:Otoferlin, partial [Gryllus bimaculatus]